MGLVFLYLAVRVVRNVLTNAYSLKAVWEVTKVHLPAVLAPSAALS